MTQPNLRALCEELAKLARQDHYRCEDSWYSCPKSPDGCANDSAGDECTCGADSHNDKIDELLARIALVTPPPEPPKNCWLDDEPDLLPSPCVFDDPDEVINNCTYARTVKCKTDCKYYRVASHPEPQEPMIPGQYKGHQLHVYRAGFHAGYKHGLTRAPAALTQPAPPTDEQLNDLWNCCGTADEYGHHEGNIFEFARAVLERWG